MDQIWPRDSRLGGIKMSKLLKAFLIVALLWVVVIGGGVLALGRFLAFIPQVVQVTEQQSREEVITKNASGVNDVNVQTKNGSVTIVGADTSDITIKAYYSARGTSRAKAEERVQALRSEVSMQGNTLNIVAVLPPTTIQNDSIRYEVTLPRTLGVRVSTSNGRVDAQGISGKVDISTSNGAVEVLGDAGPRELLVRTSNGRIVVRAAPQSGRYDLRTSNGAVQVALPEHLGVTLRASTSNGSIDLGYGQWLFQGGQISSRSINATLGDGKLQLDINTSNGSVRLEKR